MANSSALKQILEQEDDPITEICYSDRYINNPITLKLLIEVFASLKKLPCGDNQFPIARVLARSYRRDDERASFLLWHDWRDSAARNMVLSEMLEYCGFTVEVQDEHSLSHARVLSLKFESGAQFLIQLDQGFSFWKWGDQDSKSKSRWCFDRSVKEQAGDLILAGFAVVGDNKSDNTQIYVAKL